MIDIQKIAETVGKTGDEMLDYVRLNAAMSGADVRLVKEVFVEKMPDYLRERMQGRVHEKACYHNALEAVKASGKKADTPRYVLGYWCGVLPVEHCFIRVGKMYYDPTGEMLYPDETKRYFRLYELKREKLQVVARYMRNTYKFTDHISMYEFHRYLHEVGSLVGYKLADMVDQDETEGIE